MPRNRNRKMTAIDLFCGLGGCSEGARQAGVDVRLAVNHWRVAVQSHLANHPETKTLCARDRGHRPAH